MLVCNRHFPRRLCLSLGFCSLSFLAAATTAARAQDAPATPTPPEGMVYVPAGDFLMGTNMSDGTDNNQDNNTPLAFNDARPQHTAATKAFFLDKTEVTNAQYKQFCDATHYPPPPQWINGKYPDGQDEFPVTRVTWYEARAYATWKGKRLPTEAEWEHAARGTDGRQFPWGANYDLDKISWGDAGLARVGSKPGGASPYGALDMAGNAAEWTSDWFDAYPGSPTKQPDFGNKRYKVVRGGAWFGSSDLNLAFYRQVCRPDQHNLWVGFRCAKDAN